MNTATSLNVIEILLQIVKLECTVQYNDEDTAKSEVEKTRKVSDVRREMNNELVLALGVENEFITADFRRLFYSFCIIYGYRSRHYTFSSE